MFVLSEALKQLVKNVRMKDGSETDSSSEAATILQPAKHASNHPSLLNVCLIFTTFLVFRKLDGTPLPIFNYSFN